MKFYVNQAEFNAIMAACETEAMRDHLAQQLEVIQPMPPLRTTIYTILYGPLPPAETCGP